MIQLKLGSGMVTLLRILSFTSFAEVYDSLFFETMSHCRQAIRHCNILNNGALASYPPLRVPKKKKKEKRWGDEPVLLP